MIFQLSYRKKSINIKKMKKLSYFIIAILVFAPFYSAGAQSLKGDTERSTILWHGEKIGGAHDGTIDLKSADVKIEDKMPVSGSVVIDMTTIVDTDIKNDGMRKKLEEHLRSDDFFGVADHPEAVFSISSSEKTVDGIKVKGDLTIKGKTQPYEFITQMEEAEGGFIFKGKMDIDRTLFDVRYGSKKFFAKIGDRAIDDIFTLKYELYLE